MTMQKFHDAPGSEAWHSRRARCFNAGDAAAMMGCSPLQTRTGLLHQVHTGIDREFSDYVQKRVIDPGHRVEELCRPIAEDIIGEDLTVLAASLAVAGLSRPLGASLDGTVFMMDTNWECKSLNDEIRAALPHEGRGSADHNDGAALPLMYRVQMSQQAAVNGAKRCLFSAAKFDDEGNVLEERHAWFTVEPALCADIIAGWKQFDVDLAAYVPVQIKERPPADVVASLPALVIHAKGEITTSNMKEYGAALAERLAYVRSIALVTDLDFSNAKAGANLLREEILKAKTVKAAMLQQTMTVGEAASMIDTWCEDMRVTALQLEKDVEREDKAKKAAMVLKSKTEYDAHVEALKVKTGGPWIVLLPPNWPEALKNKRSYASMQDALDTLLANSKIAAAESASKICAALTALDEEAKGYEHLFADRLAFISKPADDVRALVKGRIAERRAADAKKEAEAEAATQLRIKAAADAAAAKATADAAALAQKQAADAAEEARADERRRVEQRDADLRSPDPAVRRAAQATMKHPNGAPMYGTSIKETGDFILLTDDGKRSVFCDLNDDPEPEAQPIRKGGGIARHAATPAPAPAVLQMPARAAAPAAPAPLSTPTLTIGAINDRLNGPKVDGAFLSALGFTPTVAKASRLYHEAQFSQICAALVAHIEAVQAQQAA